MYNRGRRRCSWGLKTRTGFLRLLVAVRVGPIGEYDLFELWPCLMSEMDVLQGVLSGLMGVNFRLCQNCASTWRCVLVVFIAIFFLRSRPVHNPQKWRFFAGQKAKACWLLLLGMQRWVGVESWSFFRGWSLSGVLQDSTSAASGSMVPRFRAGKLSTRRRLLWWWKLILLCKWDVWWS